MTEHERRPRRSFAAPIAWIALALLLTLLPACSKADASTMLDDLGTAGAAGSDELVSVEIAGNTYVLNITQSTLSKLSSGKRKPVTVPVGDGGTPQLVAAERELAVLDVGTGLVEWFDLDNLLRRKVTLGEGRWQAAIDDRGVVFALEQQGGELVRVEAEGRQRRTKATDPETTATVSVIEEGVLVRDLARRQDVVFDRDTLARLRTSDIADLGNGNLLPALGPDAANWVLNETTGELIGLGMAKGWRGKVAVGVGSDGFDRPLVIGDWVYVHRPDAGRVVVVRTANGALAGVVDTGMTGTQLLAEGDHATIVQVERGYTATLRGTDLRVLRSKDASGVALPDPVLNTTRAAEAVKVEPTTVDPKATTTASSEGPTTAAPSTGTNTTSTPPAPTGSDTPVPPPTPKDLNPACAPVAPSGVTLSADEPTVATVRWSVSSKTCLGGFRVQWGSNDHYLGQADVGPDATAHTISGLPSAARTDVDVFSLDVDGKVVDVTRQRVQTDMPPKCPPASPASTALTAQKATVAVVSWSIISTECLGGFRVQWGSEGTFLGQIDLGPEATAHTITDLPSDAKAEVDLFSLGLDGKVVDASRQHLETEMPDPDVDCPPLAPASPTITAQSSTTVLVQWTAGSTDCLGGFRLQWGASGQFLGRIDLGPDATQQAITDLPPATTAEVDLFSLDRDGRVVDATRQRLTVSLPV